MQLPRLPQANNPRFLEITRFERAARAQGFTKIAGIDEAGRGPLAGPVVAAACVLPENFFIAKIDDSKRLSEKAREEIFSVLAAHPDVQYGIGRVEAIMIDQINILQAALLAMASAVAALKAAPDFALVDGNKTPPLRIPCRSIIRGDTLSQSIMAAAIIAKVLRDRHMLELDEQFPEYGFASHKGYATPEHLAALEKWGPCLAHRMSYAPVKQVLQ